MWSAGDFGQIAKFSAAEAENFVSRLPNFCGGTGTRCGLRDRKYYDSRSPKGRHSHRCRYSAENLIEQAIARAHQEGLKAEFREGDAERLPFPDAEFDLVVTIFWGDVCSRPELVVVELSRVCRPGGLIAMANWTPEGSVGKMFALTSRHVPPPEGIPPPVLWGKEEVVRERFAKVGRKVETFRRNVEFKYPFDSNGVVEFFRRYFGPTQMAFARLDSAGRSALATDMAHLFAENNQGKENETIVNAEYLRGPRHIAGLAT